MDAKLKLLRSLELLQDVADADLASLGERLKPVPLEDGGVLFEEGAEGGAMYFVAEGRIRVFKRASDGQMKDLTILQPGDCLGEMDLLGGGKRSAGVGAAGKALVYELRRDDMQAWLESRPVAAISFFAELARVQSNRLRQTSEELTMLFDVSNLLVEGGLSSKALLSRAFGRLLPHLPGQWAGAAHLYNPYNEEMELAAASGTVERAALDAKLPIPGEARDAWVDERSFYAVLPGARRPLGYMLFQAAKAPAEKARANLGRVLGASCKLLASAIENINFQTEDALRARLKEQSHGQRI
jgi:CRP-like cAMP-binding protein